MPASARPTWMAILPTAMAMSPKADRAAFLKSPQASPPPARVPTRFPRISLVRVMDDSRRELTSLVMSWIFSVSALKPMPMVKSPSCAVMVSFQYSASTCGRTVSVGVITPGKVGEAPPVMAPASAMVAHFAWTSAIFWSSSCCFFQSASALLAAAAADVASAFAPEFWMDWICFRILKVSSDSFASWL